MKNRLFAEMWLSSSMALLVMAMFCGCARQGGRLERVPVKVVWEEEWCMSDRSGRLSYEGRFPGKVSPVVNGCFWAEDSSGLVGVYRATGTPKPISGLQGLKSAGYYSDGLIPVFTSDGVLKVCDGFGREQFRVTEIGGAPVTACSAMFSEGLLSVGNKLGLWGAVNAEGQLVVAARYAMEFSFHNGVAHVSVCTGKGADASYTNKLIDYNGHEVILDNPVGSGLIDDVNHTYIIYSDVNGHRGLADRNGNVVLRPRYNSLEFGSGNLLLASNAQRYFLIDDKGNEVSDFDRADEVIYIGAWGEHENDFGYAARFGALWSLYDRAGNRIGSYEYVMISGEVLSGPEPIRATGIGGNEEAALPSADALTERFEVDSVYAVPDSVIFQAEEEY